MQFFSTKQQHQQTIVINKIIPIWIWYAVSILFALFSFYYGLGSYPLGNNNEGLYASIAKSMAMGSSFIIPHLNCLPYIEKPPLLYWLMAFSFHIFGFTAFAARFITATSAFLLCLVMLCFSHNIHRLKNMYGTSIILATSIGVIIIARMVFFDMLLTFLVTTTLLCLFYWQNTQYNKSSLRFAYASLALAILAKGFIAVILTGGIFLAFLLVQRISWQQYKKLFDFPGLILFLAIVLPWHIIAAIQHPNFTWDYIINEQLLRFLNMRSPHDYYHGSIFYYFPRIIIYLFPWSLFLPLLTIPIKQTTIATNVHAQERSLTLFLWLWFLIPLTFFTISSAKANYYMIIAMPSLAMLLAIKLQKIIESKYKTLITFYSAAIIITVVGGILFYYSRITQQLPYFLILQNKMILLLGYGIITSIVTLIFYRKPIIALASIAGLTIPIVIIAIAGIPFFSEQLSAANLGNYIKQHGSDKEVYLYQDFEKISALSFYTDKCLKIVDSHSNDLFYAQQLPQYSSYFLTIDQFYNVAKNQSIYIISSQRQLPTFHQALKTNNFCIIKQFEDNVLLSNDQTDCKHAMLGNL